MTVESIAGIDCKDKLTSQELKSLQELAQLDNTQIKEKIGEDKLGQFKDILELEKSNYLSRSTNETSKEYISSTIDGIINKLSEDKTILDEIIKDKNNNSLEKVNDDENFSYNSLSDDYLNKLNNAGITELEYNKYIEKFSFSGLENTISSILYLKDNGLLNMELLSTIGDGGEELVNNFSLLFKNIISVDNILTFYNDGKDLSITINNIKLLIENGVKFSAQQYYDHGDKLILQEFVDFLKIDTGFSEKDVVMFNLYGRSLDFIKEVKENNPGVFEYFKDISIDKHYVVELARNGFNFEDFKGYENIFKKENIVDIVSLYNRNNNITNDDIKYYFTKFDGKLDYEGHNTYYYIEEIDNIIGDDKTKLDKYIINGDETIIDIKVSLFNEKEKKLLDEKNNKATEETRKYINELGELGKDLPFKEVYEWLIKYKIEVDKIKVFLSNDFNFSPQDLAYLGTDSNWEGLDNLNQRKEKVSEYLHINGNFNGEMILYLYKYETKVGNINDLFKKFNNITIKESFSDEETKKIIDYIKDRSNGLSDEKIIERKNDYLEFIDSNNQFKDKLIEEDYCDLLDLGVSNNNISILVKEYLEGTILNWEHGTNHFFGNLNEILNLGVENLNSLLDFLSNNEININILKQDYKVNGNLQFLRGLLDHVSNNLRVSSGEINWNHVIESYGKVLSEFAEENKKVDKVYFLSSNHYYGEDSSNYQYKNINKLKQIYSGSDILDFTSGTEKGEKLNDSRDMISLLESDLKNNPSNNFMLYISLHGDIAGNAWTSKGNLTKDDFSQLNNLSDKYPNLKILVDSCNNSAKFGEEEKKGNIISNSGDYFSVGDYGEISMDSFNIGEDGFAKGDFDKNGIVSSKEVELYTNLNYQSGGVWNGELKSFYKNKYGDKVSIDKNMINS